MIFPGIADPADRFAEAYGRIDDRLQSLRLDRAECSAKKEPFAGA
jgi:hypothetical protein